MEISNKNTALENDMYSFVRTTHILNMIQLEMGNSLKTTLDSGIAYWERQLWHKHVYVVKVHLLELQMIPSLIQSLLGGGLFQRSMNWTLSTYACTCHNYVDQWAMISAIQVHVLQAWVTHSYEIRIIQWWGICVNFEGIWLIVL